MVRVVSLVRECVPGERRVCPASTSSLVSWCFSFAVYSV